MTKFFIMPFSISMTFTSCPPISTTVRTFGNRNAAPLAWPGKLAHLHVGKAIKAVAPVARGKDEIHLLARHARVFQHLSDRAGWTRRARADSDEGLGNDLAAIL